VADLHGYRRALDKKSEKRWGSRAKPCPTLRLVEESQALCRGVAFEFSDLLQSQLLQFLVAREGRDFPCRLNSIRLLEDGLTVDAYVSMYSGRNLFGAIADKQIADSVIVAEGDSGPCARYVESLVENLLKLGIEDPELARVWSLVKSHPATRAS
jgi:cation transport regulator ChaC